MGSQDANLAEISSVEAKQKQPACQKPVAVLFACCASQLGCRSCRARSSIQQQAQRASAEKIKSVAIVGANGSWKPQKESDDAQ